MTSHAPARDGVRRALFRWLVHLGLIGTVIVSLVFEPLVLAIHIAVGLAFAVLAGLHLLQRRRVSASLLRRLARLQALAGPAGRLALADMLPALNDNRELGLIISSHPVMSAIASTFASDFRDGKHWA